MNMNTISFGDWLLARPAKRRGPSSLLRQAVRLDREGRVVPREGEAANMGRFLRKPCGKRRCSSRPTFVIASWEGHRSSWAEGKHAHVDAILPPQGDHRNGGSGRVPREPGPASGSLLTRARPSSSRLSNTTSVIGSDGAETRLLGEIRDDRHGSAPFRPPSPFYGTGGSTNPDPSSNRTRCCLTMLVAGGGVIGC